MLDIGCGTGAQTLVLAHSSPSRIVAVDNHSRATTDALTTRLDRIGSPAGAEGGAARGSRDASSFDPGQEPWPHVGRSCAGSSEQRLRPAAPTEQSQHRGHDRISSVSRPTVEARDHRTPVLDCLNAAVERPRRHGPWVYRQGVLSDRLVLPLHHDRPAQGRRHRYLRRVGPVLPPKAQAEQPPQSHAVGCCARPTLRRPASPGTARR